MENQPTITNRNIFKKVFSFFNKHKIVTVLYALILLTIPLLLLLFNFSRPQSTTNTSLNPTPLLRTRNFPTEVLTPTKAIQQPFRILKTTPPDGSTNVYSGEIAISFTTDVPVIAANSYTVTITPQLTYSTKIESSFPTKQVIHRVLGNLNQGTQHTVTVKDNKNIVIQSWKFTTTSERPRDNSQLVKYKEEEHVKKYYPLLHDTPYSNKNFSIDYKGRLILEVRVKSSNINAVKQEVNNWIRSHGVDPTTHTINYIT